MPELPDVEGFRQVVLCHGTRARRGRRRPLGDDRSWRDGRGLVDGLRRRTIVDARRHGKWLTVVTDGPQLLLHFGMTGSLRWCEDVTPPPVAMTLALPSIRRAITRRSPSRK